MMLFFSREEFCLHLAGTQQHQQPGTTLIQFQFHSQAVVCMQAGLLLGHPYSQGGPLWVQSSMWGGLPGPHVDRPGLLLLLFSKAVKIAALSLNYLFRIRKASLGLCHLMCQDLSLKIPQYLAVSLVIFELCFYISCSLIE